MELGSENGNLKMENENTVVENGNLKVDKENAMENGKSSMLLL